MKNRLRVDVFMATYSRIHVLFHI